MRRRKTQQPLREWLIDWTIVILAMVFGIVMMMSVNPAHADWVDDWFDQSTSSGPSSFKGQRRGYYNAGGFSGRWKMTNDYLVTAEPPRLSVGCGGIDLFGGAFSYMDPEYLVEKFQRILQAAPAFAFQIAMDNYCKPCKTAMDTLTYLTDQLNSMQINDCRMAKRVVQAVFDDDTTIMSEIRSEVVGDMNLSAAWSKNRQDFQESTRANAGLPVETTEHALDGCPALFRQIYAGGSVIEAATGLVGLSGYAPFMRGLVGDVLSDYDHAHRLYHVRSLPACAKNDELRPDDLLDGSFDVMDRYGDCSASSGTAVQDVVRNRLVTIANKIEAGQALTSDEEAFLGASSTAVFPGLRDAVRDDMADVFIDQVNRMVAMDYAAKILTDLYRATQIALEQAVSIADGVHPHQQCQVEIVREAVSGVQRLSDSTRSYASMARANFHAEIGGLSARIAHAEQLERTRRRQLREGVAVSD